MAVNRFKNHLVVFLEDNPYRSILNGVKNLQNVNENVIDIKNPCGGWDKVFDKLEENLNILNRYEHCFILLLMDFDDEDLKSLSSFENRKKKLNKITPSKYIDRIFLLGVNHKESEALKKYFSDSKFESIGKKLVENCPNGDLSNWRNIHLECNLLEIMRMREKGVFGWLFI